MARRHESLIPLSHEHHDALLLAWRLRTGDLSKREPELRAKHVSAFFDYRLINHLKLEEELLFPAALLERHIRTEERQLFVLAQNRMKPAEMAELGRQIKAQLR